MQITANITASMIIVWLVVGALAGWAVGAVVTRSKAGFGRWANLGIGLVGALIGGFIFDGLGIDFGKVDIQITLRDLVAALLGSLLFLGLVWWIKKRRQAKTAAQEVKVS
ncbi:MAG: GlsB/YeaQ/YmgE family stress response membrane protein [Planctomycetota bacterium]|jgi:uncharacterized membrane protein YeaQ/YmgE (transglycosylase-associated protein family)